MSWCLLKWDLRNIDSKTIKGEIKNNIFKCLFFRVINFFSVLLVACWEA